MRSISRRLALLSTFLLSWVVGGCSDALDLGSDTLSRSELLVLPLLDEAPDPGTTSIWVHASETSTGTLRHADEFNRLFLQVTFPPGSIANVNGLPFEAGDSVRITLSADPGVYGFAVSPVGVAFNPSNSPTATLSFARYGDFSVADGSTYPNADAYADALDLWREVGLDSWTRSPGSQVSGDELTAEVETPGIYLVAAPR